MKPSHTQRLYANDDTIGFLASGASFCAVIALLPYINFVNYMGIGIFAGGFLSVFLAGRSLSLNPDKISSFKFGALTGILGSIAAVLIGDLIYLFADYDVNQDRFALLLKIFSTGESESSRTGSGIAGFHIADDSGEKVPLESVAQIPFTLNLWTVFQQLIFVFLISWLPGGLGGLVATLSCNFSSRR